MFAGKGASPAARHVLNVCEKGYLRATLGTGRELTGQPVEGTGSEKSPPE